MKWKKESPEPISLREIDLKLLALPTLFNPKCMPICAFGFSGHGQLGPETSVEVGSPLRLENCSEVIAASWSQAIIRKSSRFVEMIRRY